MRSRAWRQFLLRALVSGALIALLLSRVNWGELLSLLRQVRPVPLAAGASLIAISPFLIAWRTQIVLGQWGIALPYFTVLSLTWVGQFCNTFLPGSTGGDAVKFLRFCRIMPHSKAAGFAALVADRLVALLALAMLAGAAIAMGDDQLRREMMNVASGRFTVVGWAAGFGSAALLALALTWAWHKYAERFGHLTARVRRMAAAFRVGLRPTPAAAAALVLALVVHLFSVASCWLLCVALQIPATFWQVMLVLPVMMIAVVLPLTINGHGLREYTMYFYFQRWHLVSGLPGAGLTETVVALSLLMVMTDFFWSLPGGLFLLVRSGTAEPVEG